MVGPGNLTHTHRRSKAAPLRTPLSKGYLALSYTSACLLALHKVSSNSTELSFSQPSFPSLTLRPFRYHSLGIFRPSIARLSRRTFSPLQRSRSIVPSHLEFSHCPKPVQCCLNSA